MIPEKPSWSVTHSISAACGIDSVDHSGGVRGDAPIPKQLEQWATTVEKRGLILQKYLENEH